MTYKVGNITVKRAQDLVGRHVRLLVDKTARAGDVIKAGARLEVIHVRNGKLQLSPTEGPRHIISGVTSAEVELLPHL